MKTNSLRLLLLGTLALLVAIPSTFAQRQLGKKKGPVSKIYVAESAGEATIQSGDKIYTAHQSTAFDAPGTVIETKAGAHNAIVYSNGTSMFVDENTRVEIGNFHQEPFQPRGGGTMDSTYEPSMSQSDVYVPHGAIALCTSRLVSGSSMVYSTPLAGVNIRGGRVVIEAHPDESYVDLLEGDLTVHGGGKDVGGQVLRPGERAVIRPSAISGQPPTVTIQQIPKEALKADDERTALACSAKKSVTFEALGRKSGESGPGETAGSTAAPGSNEAAGSDDDSDQVISVIPAVPESPSTHMVISPDRLPGT
jgi:hypothetical protein